MKCYKIRKLRSDGYVDLTNSNESYSTQLPLKSLRILYESGTLLLENPEVIYC